MKKLLLFVAFITGVSAFAQVQPTVHNSNFDKIAKSSGSDASSAGWIQKDLGDQAETSTLDDGFAIKFDDLESDAMYQE
ncbi:MAG: hypothetical protein QNK30_05360, partial [Bacteroidales bacterium]|nr:hypothetical protein [Bacteroidales bacterium]